MSTVEPTIEEVRQAWSVLDRFTKGLVDDAVQSFATIEPRRDGVEQLYRAIGEWHEHDVEDDCCVEGCPAWAAEHHCVGCGEKHGPGELARMVGGNYEWYTCGEEDGAEGECPKSKRPCGHHCNCSWIHDVCHWCGAEFGEGGELDPVDTRADES